MLTKCVAKSKLFRQPVFFFSLFLPINALPPCKSYFRSLLKNWQGQINCFVKFGDRVGLIPTRLLELDLGDNKKTVVESVTIFQPIVFNPSVGK